MKKIIGLVLLLVLIASLVIGYIVKASEASQLKHDLYYARTDIEIIRRTHDEAKKQWIENEAQWRKAVESRDEIIRWWESNTKPLDEYLNMWNLASDYGSEIISLTWQNRQLEKQLLEKPTEVFIPLLQDLKWWDSSDNFTAWIEAHTPLPVFLYADSSGVIDFNNPKSDPRHDCDDYAEDLIKLAEKDGYRLMQVPIVNGRVFNTYVTHEPGYHIGVWTRIGNEYWYAEAVPLSGIGVVKIIDAD